MVEAYLDIKNPYEFSVNDETPNLIALGRSQPLTDEQTYEVLKRIPNIYDDEDSILGDYYEEYWENGAQDWMIRDLAANEFNRNIGELDAGLFRDFPNELHEALRDVTGHDGILLKFKDGSEFYVPWFPNQIKSATDNIGTFDGENDDIRFQASKIVSKKEQMRKDDRLQLDNIVMQKQAPYIADNLPLPDFQEGYTNNYYVIWNNRSEGVYSLERAIPVEGNEDLIMEHRREFRNGTDGITESFDTGIKRARARRGQRSGDNVDGDTDRHSGRADRLSSGQPESEGRRYSESGSKNDRYQRGRAAKYDTRSVDEKELQGLRLEVER